MWKYKEYFCFSDLAATENDGELEFILQILYQNNHVSSSRNLAQFVLGLRKREGNDINFTLLLEIYNQMITMDSMAEVRKSILDFILQKPEKIDGSQQLDMNSFETALNCQEILFSILKISPLKFVRDSLQFQFSINRFTEFINTHIEKIDDLGHTLCQPEEEGGDDWTKQDLEELRECQYLSLTNIYYQLYFNRDLSDVECKDIVLQFYEVIDIDLRKRLEHLTNIDFNEYADGYQDHNTDDNTANEDDEEDDKKEDIEFAYRESEIKFVVSFM